MTEQSHAGENLLISWGQELDELDAQIKALQDAKRDFYTSVRDNHGKVTADALKAAQRIRGMDSEKRAKAEEVDAETARILAVLEKPRVARGARTREIIEKFDPKTGELESATTRGESDAKSAHAAAYQDDLIDGRRQEGEAEHQPLAETPTDDAPRESAADEISRPIPQSPVSISSPEQAKPEADSSSASGAIQEPFEPLAFLKKDEVNERCEKQGDCKFAKHPQKVTCSDCGTAWAISQRKREAS